jgi:hypothetical protein
MNVTPMALLWLADVIAQQTPSADKPLVHIDREQAHGKGSSKWKSAA